MLVRELKTQIRNYAITQLRSYAVSSMSTRPSRHHLVLVARQLKGKLGREAFLTLPRMEITELLREVSDSDGTRIKSGLAGELEQVLLEQGVRCYPGLRETTTGDTVRLFHSGSLLGSLLDLLIYPSRETDRDLGNMLKKIKGQWQWSTPTGPAEAVAAEIPAAAN